MFPPEVSAPWSIAHNSMISTLPHLARQQVSNTKSSSNSDAAFGTSPPAMSMDNVPSLSCVQAGEGIPPFLL